MSRRFATSRRAATTLAVAAVVSACAGIPTGGPVQQVAEDGDAESTARYAPAPPATGATAQQVVSGYLDAQLAFPPSTGVAEQYLTDGAAERWNPNQATRVYADPVLTVRSERAQDQAEARITSERVVDLDSSGAVERSGGSVTNTIGLVRVDGEWRIDDPPPGLMISEKFFEDYYRAYDLYFFDEPGKRLVPSVVHVPTGDQLATSLVTSLARGPVGAPAQARTYVPELDAIRSSVPVDPAGVADVDLGSDVAELSAADQGRLAAQVVATLRQVREVTGVRLNGGSTVLSPRGQSVQPIDSWGRYMSRASDAAPYAIADDTVLELSQGRGEPVPRGWDLDASRTAEVVVGSARLATVATAGDQVVVRARTGAGRVEVAASNALTARWLPGDVLLVVDRPGQNRVRAVGAGDAAMVRAPALAQLDLTSFAVSADGSRYAVTTGVEPGAVLVGDVMRNERDVVTALGDPTPVRGAPPAPTSVSWVSGTRLAFLAGSELGRQAFEVSIDGTGLTGGGVGGSPVLPDVGTRVLVVAGPDRWAVDARDRLWYLAEGAAWTRIDVAPVRSLSPGQ